MKRDWHITDISDYEKNLLLNGVKKYLENKIPSCEILDVCLVGSRALPEHLKRFVRPDSDIDIVVRARMKDFSQYQFLYKTTFNGSPMHIIVRDENYDCRFYGKRKFPSPYYSLVTNEWFVPDDDSYLVKHLFLKYGVKGEAKCTRCGVSITPDNLHLVQVMGVYTKLEKVGVLCTKCYGEFVEQIEAYLNDRR